MAGKKIKPDLLAFQIRNILTEWINHARNSIIIPRNLRQKILEKIHIGHMELDKCKALVHFTVYWPGISKDIKKPVHESTACIYEAKNPSEHLKPTSFSQRPWEMVAMDLFRFAFISDSY